MKIERKREREGERGSKREKKRGRNREKREGERVTFLGRMSSFESFPRSLASIFT